jgi:hypothetical protein
MAGFILTTDLEADRALSLAIAAAREQGFDVGRFTPTDFRARRGRLVLSLLLGPFVLYCNLSVGAHEFPEGVRLIIERNFPWWAGFSGIRQVRQYAEKLANAIDRTFRESGGRILDREEF